MKNKLLLLAILIIIPFFHSVSSNNNVNSQVLILEGGQKGNVAFPHKKHQQVVSDCNECHILFPKQKGKITEMIKTNKLVKKQVMNHCRDCHIKMIKDGIKSGPIKCMECHNNI